MKFLLVLFLVACSGAETSTSIMQAAIACHQKGIAITDGAGTCEERLLRLKLLVAKDPDCVRVYQDAGTGLSCLGNQ